MKTTLTKRGQTAVPAETIRHYRLQKASYPISFADPLIAAYACLKNASLVHKDPEYLMLEKEIDMITLPMKKNLEEN